MQSIGANAIQGNASKAPMHLVIVALIISGSAKRITEDSWGNQTRRRAQHCRARQWAGSREAGSTLGTSSLHAWRRS